MEQAELQSQQSKSGVACMVDFPRHRIHPPAGDTPDHRIILHVQKQEEVDLHPSHTQSLRLTPRRSMLRQTWWVQSAANRHLRERAGESVQDESESLAVALADSLTENVDDDLVGHELSTLHDGTHFREVVHAGTEDVAGAKVNQLVPCHQHLALRALATSRSTRYDDTLPA
jgi:hypothetical protein